jgi:hypothetical protein
MLCLLLAVPISQESHPEEIHIKEAAPVMKVLALCTEVDRTTCLFEGW